MDVRAFYVKAGEFDIHLGECEHETPEGKSPFVFGVGSRDDVVQKLWADVISKNAARMRSPYHHKYIMAALHQHTHFKSCTYGLT